LKLDYHNRAMVTLMADVNEGGVPLQKASQCQIDQLGNVKSHSCFINNPERLRNQKMRMELLWSFHRAKSMGLEEEAVKKKASVADSKTLVPDA
jgi:hypothetical protein